MKNFHEIGQIEFAGGLMWLEIDGQVKEYSLDNVSPALAQASELERMTYEVSPSGYGIHWPLLDEDIACLGLSTGPNITLRKLRGEAQTRPVSMLHPRQIGEAWPGLNFKAGL